MAMRQAGFWGSSQFVCGKGDRGDGRGHSSWLKYSGDSVKETDLFCLGKGENYRESINRCTGPWRRHGRVLGQQIQDHKRWRKLKELVGVLATGHQQGISSGLYAEKQIFQRSISSRTIHNYKKDLY